MTYCLGWCTDHDAFVIADSAVTSIAPLGKGHVTSFGETIINEGGISVCKAALKVARIDNYGLTFAGDAVIGRDFVNIVDHLVGHGVKISAALTSAIQSAFPFNEPAPIEFVCAAHVEGAPVLYTHDPSADSLLRDDQKRVHLGSLGQGFRDDVEKFLDLAEKGADEAPHRLACLVAFLQTTSVKGDYLPEGVGDFFGGLYVDECGAQWQQDIVFTFFTPDFGEGFSKNADNPDRGVIVIFRNDIAYIASPYRGSVEAYPRFMRDENESDLLARVRLAESEVLSIKSNMTVDFVAMVSRDYYVTALVEMKRKLGTRYLGIERIPIADGKEHFTFHFSEDLGNFLLKETEHKATFEFRFLKYLAAGPNQMRSLQN